MQLCTPRLSSIATRKNEQKSRSATGRSPDENESSRVRNMAVSPVSLPEYGPIVTSNSHEKALLGCVSQADQEGHFQTVAKDGHSSLLATDQCLPYNLRPSRLCRLCRGTHAATLSETERRGSLHIESSV